MRNERGEIITTEIQRIVRNYYEWLYEKKFEYLCEMKKFLETYYPPKVSQEAESLHRLISASEIEPVIKKFLAHKTLGQMEL